MTTRLQRAQAAASNRLLNEQRFSNLMSYVWPIVVIALEKPDELPDPEHDFKLTARQLRDKFGPLGSTLIEHLFIRWQTKAQTMHGPRAPRWRLSPAAAFEFAKWVNEQHNNDIQPTLREACDFIKTKTDRIRRVRIYDETGPTPEHVLLSKEEHQKLLLDGQRQARRAWSRGAYGIRSPEEAEQHNAQHH